MRSRNGRLIVALLAIEIVLAYEIALALGSLTGSRDARAAEGTALHHYAFHVAADAQVTIDDRTADVEITGWDAPRVEVDDGAAGRGWFGRTVPPLVVEHSETRVALTRPATFGPISGGGTISVRVPRTSRLTITTAGSLRGSGLRAPIDATVANGNVTLADIRSSVGVQAKNGRVDLHDVRATDLEVGAGNGRITAQDVYLEGAHPRATFSSGNGAVNFAGSLAPNGTYRFSTGNGSVRLSFFSGADLTISAQIGLGRIHADDGILVRGDDRHSLVAVLGNGSGSVSARSGNGSITISQQQGAR